MFKPYFLLLTEAVQVDALFNKRAGNLLQKCHWALSHGEDIKIRSNEVDDGLVDERSGVAKCGYSW